jgi:hypothetical protein
MLKGRRVRDRSTATIATDLDGLLEIDVRWAIALLQSIPDPDHSPSQWPGTTPLPSIVAGVAPRPLGNRPLRAQCNGALSCLCCGNLTYIVALTLIRQGNPARRLHAYQSRVPSSWRFTSVPDNQIDKRWQKSIVTGCSFLLRHKHQRLRVAGIETCAVWS